jgi:hypothetical protein
MLTSREPPSRLTALVSLLEWTLLLLLAYLEWGGDSTPSHVVTIATVGWIVIALMCAMLWVISLLNEDRTAP